MLGFIFAVLVVLALIAAVFGRTAAQQALMWGVLLITTAITSIADGIWQKQTVLDIVIAFVLRALFLTLIAGGIGYLVIISTFDMNAKKYKKKQISEAQGLMALVYCTVVPIVGGAYSIWIASKRFTPPNVPSNANLVYPAATTGALQYRPAPSLGNGNPPAPMSGMPYSNTQAPVDFSERGADPSQAFAPNGSN